jgi:hypothetical protein
MKTHIVEIEREEIAPGQFWRLMWSNVPSDALSFEDTQEFFERTDQMWPKREAISTLLMRRIRQDRENRPDHFFESVSTPPRHGKVDATDPVKN